MLDTTVVLGPRSKLELPLFHPSCQHEQLENNERLIYESLRLVGSVCALWAPLSKMHISMRNDEELGSYIKTSTCQRRKRFKISGVEEKSIFMRRNVHELLGRRLA